MKVAGESGGHIADAIEELGFVCVPRIPSHEMLHEARHYEQAEDANGVWLTMISVSEGTFKEEETQW